MSTKRTLFLVCAFFLHSCGGGGGGSQPPTPPPPPVNSAPVAAIQSVATDPDIALNGVLSATDADGDSLTYAVVTQPASGTLALSGTASQDFVYTPTTGFAGADSFTFSATDGTATSASAAVTINVNFKPVAVGTNFSTSEIVAFSGALSATDAEADTVTFAVSTPPSKGTISSLDSATGAFTYTPDITQDGADTFGVTATDAFQTSSETTVSAEIFRWAGTHQFGTALQDFTTTKGLYRTADDGFVFGGMTAGQIAATPSNGGEDAWLRKVDRRGNEVWTAQFGTVNDDNSRVLVADAAGTGTTVIAAVRDITNNNIGTATVYRIDNDGNETSSTAVDFQGIPILTGAYQAAADANGDLYIVSWMSGLSSVITKVDGSNGNTLWQRVLEGTLELTPTTTPFNAEWGGLRLRSVDVDAAGNVLLGGHYSPDTAVTTRPCVRCGLLLSYDPDGTLLSTVEVDAFATACAQSSEGVPYRITVAPDQTLWAVGWGGFPVDTSFAQVSRLSADGSQVLWSHCDTAGIEGSLYFTPVLIASNGDGLVVGTVENNIDPMTFIGESATLVVTRLDVDGNVVFRQPINTTRADGSAARIEAGSILEDPQGLLFLTGTTDGEFVSGAAVGGRDSLLIRMDANGALQ